MAVIIDPIQQVGNYFATKYFYQNLEKIVKSHNSAFIVNESFCGFGGSGKLWVHEHFRINPDILTYGCKCQASGFFMKKEFRPQHTQVINTWCGDPLRVELLTLIPLIIRDNFIVSLIIGGSRVRELKQSWTLGI